MYNITFQQMEAFLTVAKYLNFSKAANAMFISQSALSKTLQRFEEGVELQLFTRSNQGLALTDEGKYLYANLEALYHSMDKTIKTARSISVQPKTLRIVAPASFDAAADFDELKELVAKYENQFPKVTLTVTLFDFRELRQALELGDADLVFTQDFPVADIQGISFRRISTFERFIAISAHHPLASSDTLDYAALSDEIFYAVPIPKDLTNLNNTLKKCQTMGFTPKGLEFVPNFMTLLYNIRQCKGVGIIGRYEHLGFGDIKYYPLPEPEKHNVIVAWRGDRLSSEAHDFIHLISEADLDNSEK
ncbi:DNA-binding transcriptional regulator, LysR family [Sporobacter termitidis DSM 10068]|uniref:DNA-binding transcriptional regulator, LysR family n=1 Tax=Sporobacter termitidis DSM 10068 TaxID=1123282 RepID=A0A1M5ZIV1_9FIRM|nr:LysR family transcriptional regulator [Sporobacter termitidis]SHI24078.1 DNA-binding transcriptional regulator, LysR family [Sporobacter termitidis DSM 10068]